MNRITPEEPALQHSDFLRIENATAADVEDPERFAALCRQTRQEAIARDMVQVRALLAAGWKYELPDVHDPDPMSWYWRAPPKREGSRGQKYLSTNQAYNAMRKATEDQ